MSDPGPAREYRTTLSDRYGSDVYLVLRAAAWVLPVSIVAGVVAGAELIERGVPVLASVLAGVLAVALAEVVGTAAVGLVTHGVGTGFARLLWPSGASTAAEEGTSLEHSLVARGQPRAAALSYERKIAANPEAASMRNQAADLYACSLDDPARARELFEEVRAIRRASREDRAYATNRLIDLYLGPLRREPGTAERLRTLAGELDPRHAAAVERALAHGG